MKRKIAAILAADIAGYSRLVAEDEEETLRRLAAYRAVFEDFISNRGGRVFSTAGDSVLAEFPSSVDAVRCAIEVQESLRTRNMAFPSNRQMLFRIGVTIADVVERDGDLLGDGVNIAARLENIAAPGGICVSRAVHEQVANKLSVQFTDIGQQIVKNIPEPVHAYVIALNGDTGAPRTIAMEHGTGHRPQVRRGSGITAASVLSGIAALAACSALAVVLLRPQGGTPVPGTGQPASTTAVTATTPTAIPTPLASGDVKPAPPVAAATPTPPPASVQVQKSPGAPREPLAAPAPAAPPAAPPAATGPVAKDVAPPTAPGAAPPTAPASAPQVAPADVTAASEVASVMTQPFDIRAVPLVPPGQQGQLRAALAGASGRKALAVAANGRFGVGSDPTSTDEAARKASDACKAAAGNVVCRVIAVDDAFVVAIPRSGWIRGLFDPATSDLVAAGERSELALQLKGESGWSAVAVGAAGKPGFVRGAGSEVAAVKAALAKCGAVDRGCRIIAIGPFRVEQF